MTSLHVNPYIKYPYTIWIFCRNQNWHTYEHAGTFQECLDIAQELREGTRELPAFFRNPNLNEIKVTGKGSKII